MVSGVTNMVLNARGVESPVFISRGFAFALLLILSGTATRAQDIPAGRRLAEAWCAGCHMVAPDAIQSPNDAIPSFAAIARMPSTTMSSLNAFLQSPHPPMPDLKLSRAQISDISAYILSLRPRR